jgi:hypothetical protein
MSNERLLSMYDLRDGQRVRNVKTGNEGTVGPQSQFFHEDGPVRVAYDGYDHLSYVEESDRFVVIGENKQVADLERCGRGKDACIFAGIGPNGPECLRFGPMHESSQWRKSEMGAKREPFAPWPECWVTAK